jgi:serine O-acetyltransferase
MKSRQKIGGELQPDSQMGVPAESFGFGPALDQLCFMGHELALMTHGRAIRWIVLFFEPSAGVIISYRLDRFGYLLSGKIWTALRVLFFPAFLLLRFLSSPHEICFNAAIGKGLRIGHPVLGVVVTSKAIVGKDCTLYGGNSIGMRRGIQRGELMLGDNVTLGINACVLGPAKIGNHVTIGAGGIVTSDLADGIVAVGVPARPMK